MHVKNAYEFREEFSRDGKCLKRERTVGPIVPWAIVAALGLLMGQTFSLPSAFWHMLGP